MRKQLWLMASLILIFALTITSCGGSTPAPTQEPTEDSQPQATPTSKPAPPATAPASSSTNPYPGPGPAIEYITTIDPYPAPAQGEKIEWSAVEALVAAGGVADVFQSHTLQVIINMKDGTGYVVIEPAKDEIFKLLDQCGEKCFEVKRVSEWFY